MMFLAMTDLLVGQLDLRLRSTLDTRSAMIVLTVVAGVGLVALMVRWYWNRYDYRKHRSAAALFAELCRAHQLSWSERRLLSQLAVMASLNPKAVLFVNPDVWARVLPRIPDPSYRQQLEQLRLRLFCETDKRLNSERESLLA